MIEHSLCALTRSMVEGRFYKQRLWKLTVITWKFQFHVTVRAIGTYVLQCWQ